MKVLVISHACVVDVNQGFFAELAKFEDLEIASVIPSVFNTDLREKLKFLVLPKFDARVFAMRPLLAGKNRLLGNKGIHPYFYPNWWKPVREFKSDIIYIDEEPWNLSALQFALSGKKSGVKILFYSKQNILKRLFSLSGEIPNIIRKTGGGLVFQEKNIKDLAGKIHQLGGREKNLAEG